ncbi:MAG: NAD(P)H-dependent oxidoreductase, partial [Marinosulfonomonas sp.]|nr:NAD(P)H-dependent oxidoreductase [Marinosulfonomonas sp.]
MTHHVLHIDASARTSGSISRALSDRITARFAGASITKRDLATALPQIDENWVGANFTPADDRSPDQAAGLALSDELIAEFKAADTIVIGTPIYNFAIPAALKAWIDQVVRAGETFSYGEAGPVGLLKDKRVIVAFAAGGTAIGSEIDFASNYLRFIFGFMGINDVQFVQADQLAMDAEASIAAANDSVDALNV